MLFGHTCGIWGMQARFCACTGACVGVFPHMGAWVCACMWGFVHFCACVHGFVCPCGFLCTRAHFSARTPGLVHARGFLCVQIRALCAHLCTYAWVCACVWSPACARGCSLRTRLVFGGTRGCRSARTCGGFACTCVFSHACASARGVCAHVQVSFCPCTCLSAQARVHKRLHFSARLGFDALPTPVFVPAYPCLPTWLCPAVFWGTHTCVFHVHRRSRDCVTPRSSFVLSRTNPPPGLYPFPFESQRGERGTPVSRATTRGHPESAKTHLSASKPSFKPCAPAKGRPGESCSPFFISNAGEGRRR